MQTIFAMMQNRSRSYIFSQGKLNIMQGEPLGTMFTHSSAVRGCATAQVLVSEPPEPDLTSICRWHTSRLAVPCAAC